MSRVKNWEKIHNFLQILVATNNKVGCEMNVTIVWGDRRFDDQPFWRRQQNQNWGVEMMEWGQADKSRSMPIIICVLAIWNRTLDTHYSPISGNSPTSFCWTDQRCNDGFGKGVRHKELDPISTLYTIKVLNIFKKD